MCSCEFREIFKNTFFSQNVSKPQTSDNIL